MAPQKLQAIALTYRPKNGITDQEISEIQKFADKKSTHFGAVIEMVGEDRSSRHMHALFLFDVAVAPGDLFGKTKLFGRCMKKHLSLSESIWQRAVEVKGVYNDDWYSSYMQKDAELIREIQIDQADRETYYKDVEPRPKREVADGYFNMLEQMWYEVHPDRPPRSIDECSNFMACLMYRDRKIKVIQDPRCMKQKVRALYSYVTRATHYDFHSNVQLLDEEEVWHEGPRVTLQNS